MINSSTMICLMLATLGCASQQPCDIDNKSDYCQDLRRGRHHERQEAPIKVPIVNPDIEGRPIESNPHYKPNVP